MLSTNPWIVCPKPSPQARLRLLCFPHAGGAASVFYPWADELPGDIEVCAIQLPGRESRLREPPFTRLSPLVRALVQAIQPCLSLPIAIFGHSLGALVGFELARQLRRQKMPGPVCLFVSGHRAPHLPSRTPPVHQLPQEEFIAEMRRLKGTPEEVLQHTELLRLLLPLLRADFAVNETYGYTPEAPLACPIYAFGGLEDDEANYDELVAWREHTCNSFELRMFPGDHFFLYSARAPLLQAIAEDLARLRIY